MDKDTLLYATKPIIIGGIIALLGFAAPGFFEGIANGMGSLGTAAGSDSASQALSSASAALPGLVGALVQMIFLMLGMFNIGIGAVRLIKAMSEPESRSLPKAVPAASSTSKASEPAPKPIKPSRADKLLSRVSSQEKEIATRKEELSGMLESAFGKGSLTLSTFMAPVDEACAVVGDNSKMARSLVRSAGKGDFELANKAVASNDEVIATLGELRSEILAAAADDVAERSDDVAEKVKEMSDKVRFYDVSMKVAS